MRRVECPVCGWEMGANNFSRHVRAGHPEVVDDERLMGDTDVLLDVLDGWSDQARSMVAALISEDGADAEPAAFRAAMKVAFHAGVATGLSDLGARVLAALEAVNPNDIQDGVTEIRAAFAVRGG